MQYLLQSYSDDPIENYPSIEKILTALLNEIALQIDPLILVLDDVHLLTGERKHKCIPQLNSNKAN